VNVRVKVDPAASVAVTANVEAPLDGVPLMTPVCGLSESPRGNPPEVIAQR
jgi:hypothetical protein